MGILIMKTKPLKEFPTYYPNMKNYITPINENQSQNRKLNKKPTIPHALAG